MKIFNNVTELKESRLSAGQIVKTKGYYTPNDGGGAEYLIVGSETGTDDGGSYHDLANGNQAEMVSDGIVNVKQFGAKGDGVTDDYQSVQNAVDFAGNSLIGKGLILFTKGIYTVSTSIYYTTGGKRPLTFKGVNKYESVLKALPDLTSATKPTMGGVYAPVLSYSPVLTLNVTTGCTLEDIGIEGDDLDVYGIYVNESFFMNFNRVRISACNQRPFTAMRLQMASFIDFACYLNGQGGFGFDGSTLLYDTSTLSFSSLNIERTGTDRFAFEVFQPNNKGGWFFSAPWFETVSVADGGNIPALGFMSVGGRNGTVTNAYHSYADHPDTGQLIADFKASTDTLVTDGITITTAAAISWDMELNDVSTDTRGVEFASDSFGNVVTGSFSVTQVVNNATSLKGNSASPLSFADGSSPQNVAGAFRFNKAAGASGLPIGTNDYNMLIDDNSIKMFGNPNNSFTNNFGNFDFTTNLSLQLKPQGNLLLGDATTDKLVSLGIKGYSSSAGASAGEIYYDTADGNTIKYKP